MFNLLISCGDESWNSFTYEYDRSRVAVEYTADEISERYKFLDENVIEELKSFPALFVTEGETVESRIGYITNIRTRQRTVVIDFEFDPILPALARGTIESLKLDIDLGKFELTRTHWAIKDEPIFDILLKRGVLTKEQVNASTSHRSPDPLPSPVEPNSGEFNTSQVFIVHGHDELPKLEVANFITSLGLEPIILHMQASEGRTIIEKIEHYSNVGFGIVLYTPCDIGAKAGALDGKYRARQNVVFEHGYLIGKLGRPRVAAIVKGEIETPNDISGVVYIAFDQSNLWQQDLITEMRSAGYSV